MTNSINTTSQGATGLNAASRLRPLLNVANDGVQTATAIPNRIVGLANAAARSLPDSALAAKPSPKTEAAANMNQSDQASKDADTNNGGQFNIDWNLNKSDSKDSDKLNKSVIGNS